MTISKDICVVCAWRADCQKKFSMSGKNMRCPDFTRDISISGDREENTEKAKEEKPIKK